MEIYQYMDHEFIREAEKITSFNIDTSVFQSTDKKKEIQHLFQKHFFPNFDLSKTIDTIDVVVFNSLVAELKSYDYSAFDRLHTYNASGLGPGEISLYFLVNQATIGGGNSIGDIRIGDEMVELKAAKITKCGNYAKDFRVGGTVDLAPIMTDLNVLRKKLGVYGTDTEICKTSLKEIESKAPCEYIKIEARFAEAAYDYFKRHQTVFINHNFTKSVRGRIEAIRHVRTKDIKINEMTNGTIKPIIKIKD